MKGKMTVVGWLKNRARCFACAAGVLTVWAAGAEDAYLKSSGSQWVNTGYYMNARSRVEIDFQYDEVPKGGLSAGAWRNGCGLAAAFWNTDGKYAFILNDTENKRYWVCS